MPAPARMASRARYRQVRRPGAPRPARNAFTATRFYNTARGCAANPGNFTVRKTWRMDGPRRTFEMPLPQRGLTTQPGVAQRTPGTKSPIIIYRETVAQPVANCESVNAAVAFLTRPRNLRHGNTPKASMPTSFLRYDFAAPPRITLIKKRCAQRLNRLRAERTDE
jgi:hypothetical protein